MITDTASGDPGATEHLRETQTARRVIYRGRLLTFYEDDVTLVDGTRAQREVVAHPGAVAIVAIDDDNKVVLVRQGETRRTDSVESPPQSRIWRATRECAETSL